VTPSPTGEGFAVGLALDGLRLAERGRGLLGVASEVLPYGKVKFLWNTKNRLRRRF